MANNPVLKVKSGATPVVGTASSPVNAMYSGPDMFGVLNALPPMFGDAPTPLIATNGTNTNKLGIQGGQSPKTHG